MSAPGPEDVKLLTLARAARARLDAPAAAAVRDLDGRTYSATAVALPSLQLSALQVAVAMALSSGAAGLEAAVVIGEGVGAVAGDVADAGDTVDRAGLAAVADVTSAAPVYAGHDDGRLHLRSAPVLAPPSP